VTTLAIIAVVICALFVVGLAIWLIPRWQVQRWRRAGISNEEKLAELGVQARSSITQALGGVALIVTIAITAFQVTEARRTADETQQAAAQGLRLAEQGQLAERFGRAVDQLGANISGTSRPATDVRMGALFSLMRIGVDTKTYKQAPLVVVATYVTSNYRPPTPLPSHGCKAVFRTRPDLVVALKFVLPRIAAGLDDRDLLGFRGALLNGLALDGLSFNRYNLTGIKFRNASLVGAHFRNAKLPYADFNRACLKGADFRGAALQGASFPGATLKGAKFTREELDRAPLSKAQKRQVVVVP
jgi:Pentapeptide repeats (8 copies)